MTHKFNPSAALRSALLPLITQISKEVISTLPLYQNPQQQTWVVDDTNLEQAIKALVDEPYLGFDTESRPTFRKDQPRHSIALLQLASPTLCCLFQMNRISDPSPLKALTQNQSIIKLGIGLKDDVNYLAHDYGLPMQNTVDIGSLLKALGRKDMIGSKQLVAVTLNQRLRKSRSATTSNWANSPLTPAQIAYAADDAFSSVDAYLEIRRVLAPFQKELPKNVLEWLDFSR